MQFARCLQAPLLGPTRYESVGCSDCRFIGIKECPLGIAGGGCLYAWGRIATAISANDYMDGTTNNYGVRYVRLYVDDRLVSSSDVDRFSFSEDLLINAWTDFAERRRSGLWYMRSSIATHNTLRMLHADEERGWVTIDEERDYHFRYELEDL